MKTVSDLCESIHLDCKLAIDLIDSYGKLKEKFYSKTKTSLDMSKDKFELYKEYANVLSKQLLVQDGRSLAQVKVRKEKLII